MTMGFPCAFANIITLWLLQAVIRPALAQQSPNAGLFEPTATQAWNFAPTCTAGLTPFNNGDANGTFTDTYGALWQMNCGQRNTKAFYNNNGGTNGRGISACFRGCDKRPGCVGFYFVGSVNSATSGSGLCYYQNRELSNYVLDAGTTPNNQWGSFYGGAHMIRASTQQPCPYYNGTTWQDSAGNSWAIYCQRNANNAITIGSVNAADMASCFAICNAESECTSFEFAYDNAEPSGITGGNGGVCYMKNYGGLPQESITFFATEDFATRITVTSTAVAATSSVTSVATSGAGSTPPATPTATGPYPSGFTGVCTTSGAVSPSSPACPGANQTQYTSPCGSVYTVYCGFDNTPGYVSQQTVSDLAGCMAACDAYTNCQSASLQGTTCYIKTGFTALTSNSGLSVIVRNIPPNPNYAIPPPAGTANASTGCGQPLWPGLVPNGASVSYSYTGSDGYTRQYLVHIPRYYYNDRASPLILGFHGQGGDAYSIERDSKLNDGARNPFGIAVYVTGVGNAFISNPDFGPTGSQYTNLDDISFVRSLIAFLLGSFCIDTGRIWVTGYSNGGGLVQVLACDPVMSSTISVFTGMSAAMYTNNTNSAQDPRTVDPVNTPVQAICSPSRNNVAYMEVHGVSDGTIAYYGGFRRNRVLPEIPHWATEWAARQGYSRTNTTMATGPNYIRYGFGNAGNIGIITQITITDNSCNHCWANTSPQQVDASTEFMNFFYDQTRTWGNGRSPVFATSSRSTSTNRASTATGPVSTSPPCKYKFRSCGKNGA
ncbi:hypothetical protein AC578_4437 [Pseudocercospora eumusae]|uniref:feruloyl esterase n=1 Tax=Pseudocercospora eumusae TaxID=321146 RepID=A0A139HF24_9PEZI|nr:hypothetical protein AC578_4437 [Pseudocercospora eumusae]